MAQGPMDYLQDDAKKNKEMDDIDREVAKDIAEGENYVPPTPEEQAKIDAEIQENIETGTGGPPGR
jgi:hypothetical protein